MDRCFAFDQFGPLSIRPCHGNGWAEQGRPDRLPATYRRTHGVRYFHGCYSLGDDTLRGITRRGKSGANTLAALKSIRAARPGRRPGLRHPGQPVCEQDTADQSLGGPQQRRTVPHTDLRLAGNPIEAQFGPLRTFVIGNSSHPNHTVLAWEIQAYLRWRNANARHPDVLAAQRRERARVRSERRQRRGRPRPKAA
nr:IS630 family transposase [Actinomadura sp. NAK00032]